MEKLKNLVSLHKLFCEEYQNELSKPLPGSPVSLIAADLYNKIKKAQDETIIHHLEEQE